MNLKRLEQLVRLANNNPNENEANLAARKVCKMIEEAKFKFVEDVVKYPHIQTSPTTNHPFDTSKVTYPEYKPPSPPPPRQDWKDINDFINNIFTKDDPFFVNFRENTSSTKWDKDKAPTKICERCKKEYKSPRVINVCADCQWKEEFQKNKNNEDFIKEHRYGKRKFTDW